MENSRLIKPNVWYHLLNFSKSKFLSSEYFHLALIGQVDLTNPEQQKELEKTQRELAKIINELINDMMIYNDDRRIVSSNDGYKIALSPEEIEDGWKYLFKKIEGIVKRINWLKAGYNTMVHPKADKQTQDLFV
jgi:hypothetical protein